MPKRTLLLVLVLSLLQVAAAWGSADYWLENVGAVEIGARPGHSDGYDGQSAATSSYLQAYHGVLSALYRQTGQSWSGDTGFYWSDLESPIPWGGNKTWFDIYRWAQNPTSPVGDLVPMLCGAEWAPPIGYTATLFLDYVPASLNYTGPTEFSFDMQSGHTFPIPTPTLDFVPDPAVDGDSLTRMHITVYAPVCEPSSLLTLGGGILAVGVPWLRRRARARA